MIAEIAASSGVVVSARSDLAGPDADQGVVQALATESGIDPAMVAARGIELAVGVTETKREQTRVEGVVVVGERR